MPARLQLAPPVQGRGCLAPKGGAAHRSPALSTHPLPGVLPRHAPVRHAAHADRVLRGAGLDAGVQPVRSVTCPLGAASRQRPNRRCEGPAALPPSVPPSRSVAAWRQPAPPSRSCATWHPAPCLLHREPHAALQGSPASPARPCRCPLLARSVGDVGLKWYIAYFVLYMTSVEFFVYWQHRILHMGVGYRCAQRRAGSVQGAEAG